MNNDIEIINKKELPASTVMLRSDGIIHYFFKPDKALKIEDAKAILNAIAELGEGKKHLIMITGASTSSVNTEVRFYGASEEANQYTIAVAIVVKNVAQTLLGNTYIKFNKPLKPTRIFSSEEAAVKWLMSFNR